MRPTPDHQPVPDRLTDGSSMYIAVNEHQHDVPPTLEVVVTGDVDVLTAPALQQALDAAVDRRPGRVRLDLAGVGVVSAAGITVLLAARARSATFGVPLDVVGLPARLLRLVRALGLTRFLGVHPSEALGEHLVWHQELICPGEQCRGRLRVFPPGVLLDDGRHERRCCPACGITVVVPAFYLGGSLRQPGARRPRAGTPPAGLPRPR